MCCISHETFVEAAQKNLFLEAWMSSLGAGCPSRTYAPPASPWEWLPREVLQLHETLELDVCVRGGESIFTEITLV